MAESSAIHVPHVIKGELIENPTEDFGSFKCPRIELDDLVWPRAQSGPAFNVPVKDIINYLVEVGKALEYDKNKLLRESLELSLPFSSVGRRIQETVYRTLPFFFQRDSLEFQVEQEIGCGPIDGWHSVKRGNGTSARIRAFPPRLIHILAGNTPAVAVTTIVRGALTKGVHLLKLPANDLFTASAILRTMADVDPSHPTLKSFSAVYWKGGDTKVESAIMRPQFFDKLVVWGGESAVRGAMRYAGPGFEIVSFDPKVSISFLGKEAHDSEEKIADAVERAATDITIFNQDACAASRFVYAEGSIEQIDKFCEQLAESLRLERPLASAKAAPISSEIANEIEVLKSLEPIYRVWGDYSGAGLVIRSDDPVDFYPTSKTVNVVLVPSLKEAVKYSNVATQTVGVYPPSRIAEVRDPLSSMGVQRVVTMGEVAKPIEGLPHDGFYPMHRFMRWVLDDSGL